jgi:dipeptidyl-peptidase-4
MKIKSSNVANKLVWLTLLLFISLSIFSLPLFAQQDDLSKLTLKRIYTDREFSPKGYGPIKWLEDGKSYTALEKSGKVDGQDIVRYENKTGKRTVLVPASQLIPNGDTKPLAISEYSWSEDWEKMMIFTNTQRVWRYQTRGDYWIFDITKMNLRQLGRAVKPATMMFAKFSPDGKQVAYVSDQNIYMESLETGEVKQITTDGGDKIINGTFDWLYEEELALRDGFRWSPDSRHIAYWQMNTDSIGIYYMVNNLDSIYSKLIPVPYPKVGTTNPAARIGVVSSEGGEIRWFDIPGDPRNHYLARMDWAASSTEIVIQQLNRLQNTNKVMLGDIATGKVRTILTETDKAWVDVNDDLHWLKDGKYFTWNSERDGWAHIYLVSRKGNEIRLITPGDYDAISIEEIDEKNGYIYYIASPDNATQRYLFRRRLDGQGDKERISPVNQPGNHRYQISTDAQWAIHTFSNSATPPQVDLVSLPNHKSVRMLEDNSELKGKLSQIKLSKQEFFKVEIEPGIMLDGWMIKPIDFDPAKKYPVLFFVYGEPAGSTVQDNWSGGDLWHYMLAQQGYIIISIDNRGTSMPRGREWRKCIYRQIGVLAPQEQAAAARKIMEWDFVDPERIGIWGWSGGGSMTLNCVFRFPEIYKMGIAIAFVSDQRLYDTCYQERYMGLPDDNETGYREGSPITYAHKLEGNLLIIHGTADDNVHFQNFERLVDELIKDNKKFSMMVYPMRSHSIYERENTSRHLREMMTWYLNNNLPAGPK